MDRKRHLTIYFLLLSFVTDVTQGQQVSSSNSSLPSSQVSGITAQVAAELDFGENRGRKLYPEDAYGFAIRAPGLATTLAPESAGLSQQDKNKLQDIVNECQINPPKTFSDDFVTVKDGKFELNGMSFQFLGFNSYQVIRQINQVDNLFKLASDLGLKVARIWLFSDNIRISPLEWNEQVYEKLDQVIEKAQQYGIKIVFAFSNYWEHFLGTEQYVYWAFNTLSGKTIEDFYNDDTVRLLYKAHVCYSINRINTRTNIRWRDDPTIMAWNLMNEPRCPGCKKDGTRYQTTTDWINEMANFVKSIDPNHLVTTGMEGFSTDEVSTDDMDNPDTWALCQGTDFAAGHQLQNIDYATIHIYPEHKGWNWEENKLCDYKCQINWSNQYYQVRISSATNILKKPLVLEEFGMSVKLKYRVSNADGTYREVSYTSQQRLELYKALLETQLSALERGELASGLMFWMAITNGYPDYDGFSIKLDETLSQESSPVAYNVLESFRKKTDENQCTREISAKGWRPNIISPIPSTFVVKGDSVLEVLQDASQQLAALFETSSLLTPDLPSSPGLSLPPPSSPSPVGSPMPSPTPSPIGSPTPEPTPTPIPSPMSPMSSPTPSPTPTPTPSPASVSSSSTPSPVVSVSSASSSSSSTPSPVISVSSASSSSSIPTPSPVSVSSSSSSSSTPSPVVSVSSASSSTPTPSPSPTASPAPSPQPVSPSPMLAPNSDVQTNGDCGDIAPSWPYTCEDQKGWGMCDAEWMIEFGYCKQTCGRCGISNKQALSKSRSCGPEITPKGSKTCVQYKDNNECDTDFIKNNGYCEITCDRCLVLGCTDVAPNTALTCQEQKSFDACESDWMKQAGFCAITCQRC